MTNIVPNTPGSNTGHGHVWTRPDRKRYRCGGPARCQQCHDDRTHLATTTINGIRAHRPNPDGHPVADRDHPIVVDLAHVGPVGPVSVAAALTPGEAALLAAQLAAAIDCAETTR